MNNLARIRKEKGLSQNDLLRISGVSRSVILKYETGERDINKASGITLFKLATALNCNIEDLLERKEETMKEVLFNLYCEWREAGEEATEGTDMEFTWDCGEGSAREDFTNFAGLDEEISFEEMLELEKRYE